jgi:hypothetical protein
MPETLLPIVAEGVPEDLCFSNWSDAIPIMVQYMFARFEGNEVNTGSSTPAAEDRGKPWFRTNADGTDDGWWTFYNGFWIQKHPMPTGAIIMWEGAIADIDTYDGGEAGAVTNITGPFWERATTLDARSPIGPGTLPSGTVLNIGDQVGEENHVLTIAELASHTHPFATDDGQQVLAQVTSGAVNTIDRTGSLDYGFADPVQNTGGDAGHNTIGPSLVVNFLRRTARLYRRRNA